MFAADPWPFKAGGEACREADDPLDMPSSRWLSEKYGARLQTVRNIDAVKMIEARPQMAATERILGVRFHNGPATTAVSNAVTSGGCTVIPASPALIKLNYDEPYRDALRLADLVLPDSELLVLLWKSATGGRLRKISGIEYLETLLTDEGFIKGKVLWLVQSEGAKENAVDWLQSSGRDQRSDTVRVITANDLAAAQHALLLEIEQSRPGHIVIALRGGGQEQLGIYLRDYLLYRPSIHCVGAALGFLTGNERQIPRWAQRHRLGWLARLASQPRMLLPRVATALALAWMIFRYRAEMPPLRTRWTDI